MNIDIGARFDQPEDQDPQQEFETFAGDVAEWITSADGIELSRGMTVTEMQSDGRVARNLSRTVKNANIMACGHLYSEGVSVRRSPAGRLLCERCWKTCGRCQRMFEPGEERFYLGFLHSLLHRECALEAVRQYLLSQKMGRVQIEEGERIRLSLLYHDLRREHRATHPGLLRRAWNALRSPDRGGHRVPVRRQPE